MGKREGRIGSNGFRDETETVEAPELLPTACALDVRDRRVSWLWSERIALGVVSLMEGRKGTGKTSIAAAVAADVTGGPRIGGGKKRMLGSVAWYGPEEAAASQTRPKLVAAGARMEHVHFVGCDKDGHRIRRIGLPTDFWALQNTLAHYQCKLLVIDPLSSAVDQGFSLQDEQQGRAILEPLAMLADKLAMVVLLLRHVRKGTSGPAIEQGLGGVVVGNVARTILRCDRHPERSGFVASWVAQFQGSIPHALNYDLVDCQGWPRVKWTGPSDLDAETLAEGLGDSGDRDARGDARRLLRRCIADGWTAVAAIKAEAMDAGIGERTLRTAKAELRVPSRRVQSGQSAHWQWGKPKAGWPDGLK